MFKKKWKELKAFVQGWPSADWDWRLRNLENLVDDPVDDLKHKLHGLKIGPWTLYLPRWLMRGSGDNTK